MTNFIHGLSVLSVTCILVCTIILVPTLGGCDRAPRVYPAATATQYDGFIAVTMRLSSGRTAYIDASQIISVKPGDGFTYVVLRNRKYATRVKEDVATVMQRWSQVTQATD